MESFVSWALIGISMGSKPRVWYGKYGIMIFSVEVWILYMELTKVWVELVFGVEFVWILNFSLFLLLA